MDAETSDTLQTRAIEWHNRLRDGDDATWEAFAAWLEEDPRHVVAFDEIEALDEVIDPLLPALQLRAAANDDDEPASSGRRRFALWTGGALAATLVAGLLVGPQLGSQRYEVATVKGEHRLIRVDDRTEIALNGASKIVLDRNNPRYAALLYGEALFSVEHDSRRPFVLDVGDAKVVDLGTVFNVIRDRTETRVAVSEGHVEYVGDGARIPLRAGQALADSREGQVRIADAPDGSVGAWRQRRLVYTKAPLSQVAGDLARLLGTTVRVTPSISRRPVSGVLNIPGASREDIRRIEIALDVSFEQDGDGWVMGPPTSARD